MNRISSPARQSGLSLVELMIAITLSLILTLGVIEIFSSSKQTNRTQTALGGVQENARFALDLLSYDLRMAGNIGCNRNATVTNHVAASLPDIGNGISGFEESQLGAAVFPLLINKTTPSKANVVDGTDLVVVRYASPNSVAIASATNNSITFTPDHDVKKGAPVIVSDCQNADIVIADANIDAGKQGTIKLPEEEELSKIYGADAEMAPLKYMAYYIRQGDNKINNLYTNTVIGNKDGETVVKSAEALLEGVEDFQILYGEDIDGDGSNIRYVPADTADLDMSRVTSVRISLLFSTIDDGLASGDQNYWFNGELITVASADNKNKKLYRGFTTTIKLRNKGIGS